MTATEQLHDGTDCGNVKYSMTAMVTASQNNYLTFVMLIIKLFFLLVFTSFVLHDSEFVV